MERVAPAEIEGVELSMEALAQLADRAQAREHLGGLVTQYRQWITEQRTNSPTSPPIRREVAQLLLDRAGVAADRIDAGIALLEDKEVLEAFRVANRVMARAARRRFGTMRGNDPNKIDAPSWRPFQLAFLLMNLRGIANPAADDREVVDLLFFPTGGGKTEAYLGLAAFTLVLRRLRNPGIASAGLSVLMRYTLRLLTLDQLSRAATLICALELERQSDVETLGEWPFEIGLWVGRAATPNHMGAKGTTTPTPPAPRRIAFQQDDRKPSPIPLEECPWCGDEVQAQARSSCVPNQDHPTDLRVVCVNRRCEFTRDRPLPILAVDEPIYRRLPCFLIATVDKFAAMPWTGQVGAFFGRVDRCDKDGFYGPCEPGPRPVPGETAAAPGPRHPGRAASDLGADGHDGRPLRVGPRHALHARGGREEGPAEDHRLDGDGPAGGEPDPRPVQPADRRHLPAARSPTAATPSSRRSTPGSRATPPLPRGRRAGAEPEGHPAPHVSRPARRRPEGLRADGGKKNLKNPADPYMTLLGYFNSLRELGGSRRIVEDEVSTRLKAYGGRKRIGEKEGLFADREIDYEVVELTSRVSTSKVADAKRRLAVPFHDKATRWMSPSPRT